MACLPCLSLSLPQTNETCGRWKPKAHPCTLYWGFSFPIENTSQSEISLPGSSAIAVPPDSDPGPQALLSARQREYKVAALSAKRAGDLDRARELMRIGKVQHLAESHCVPCCILQMGKQNLRVIRTGLGCDFPGGSYFRAPLFMSIPALFIAAEIWCCSGSPGEGAACGHERLASST
jgi:hypothetical protein